MNERSRFALQAFGRFCLLFALLAVLVLAPVHAGSGGVNDGAPLAPNLNGDNYGDLVVGVRDDDVQGLNGVGGINVVFGTETDGLSSTGNQYWHHDNMDGDWDTPQANDHFGEGLAVGDFNCDGLNDVAVGAWLQDIDTNAGAGAVHILWGSASTGLTGTGTQTLHQGLTGATSFGGDQFGKALAAGDFDGDHCDDLAVGVPHYDYTGAPSAGAVYCYYGTTTGLSTTRYNLWHQGLPGIEDTAEQNDYYGDALTTGYFDGDEYADLAVGVPWEDNENGTTQENAGAVNVLYGSSGGLSDARDQFWDNTSGDEKFGTAVAAGDFNGDGVDDLAIGVPYRDSWDGSQNRKDAGLVRVIYGTAAGLSDTDDQFWKQYGFPDDLLDQPEIEDHFGFALAACDFNGDGKDDLAIGVPQEDIENGTTRTEGGAVNVIYGASPRLTATGNQFFHQDFWLGGGLQGGERFGRALAAGYFDGDSYCDLAVGVPYEDYEGQDQVGDAGAVNVMYGTADGLAKTPNQIWSQGAPLLGTRSVGDFFGWTLAAASKRGTTTTITSDESDPSAVGETVTVAYVVSSTRGIPTGDVMVSDGTHTCTGTVEEGECTLAFTAEGVYSLTASYEGDAHYASSVSPAEQHTVVQETVYFNFDSYTVNEDAGSVTIAIKLGVAWEDPVTVNFATSDGTATAGADYTNSSQGVTIEAGRTGATVDIPILDDDLVEDDETILLALSNPINAVLGSPAAATVTIIDDEVAPSYLYYYLPVVLRYQ
jgi:hypothetical protein